MNATLKTLAVAFLSVAAASVMVAPASAGGECVKIKGMFFKDGERVPKCGHAEPLHTIGPKHPLKLAECEGHSGEYSMGEVNGRRALIRCR